MAQNELQLVTLTQAKRLKAAGFDWIIDSSFFQAGSNFALGIGFGSANWNDREKHRYSAPTVALALKWFRDVKGVLSDVSYYKRLNGNSCVYSPAEYYYRTHFNSGNKTYLTYKEEFPTYEEAERALLDAMLDKLEGKIIHTGKKCYEDS